MILWRLYRKACADRAALAAQNRLFVADLAVERQRSGDMLFAATAPCGLCEQSAADLADALDERDKWRQAAQFLERISGVSADGGGS